MILKKIENKGNILVLNKNYFPIGCTTLEKAFIKFFNGSAFFLDIAYSQGETGEWDFSSVDYFEAVHEWEGWAALPVRSCDGVLHTVKMAVRRPVVIVCTNWDKLYYKKVTFPTKNNIWKRDAYVCQYSGKKLTKDELSVDHIVPQDTCRRTGANPHTWENMVTCDKLINNKKGNKSLKESGLKLLRKPTKPSGGLVFDKIQDEWLNFISNY